MSEEKKIKLELPDGLTLPEGYELPEIEVEKATLRRTIISDDGRMTEIEETIDVPAAKKAEK
jgi:hypothetical protein